MGSDPHGDSPRSGEYNKIRFGDETYYCNPTRNDFGRARQQCNADKLMTINNLRYIQKLRIGLPFK